MNPVENNPPGPSRLPIYLSALLMPGAGQFLQRRWLSAFFFAMAFLVCFGFFAVVLVHYVMGFLKDVLGSGDRPPMPLMRILLPVGLSLVLYIIGLCDTYLAYLRECRVWGERRMEETLKKLVLAAALLLAPAAVLAVSPGELHKAVIAKDLLALNSLLETCTTGDVNSVIGNGITPLHLAATLDQRASVGMLAAQGAILDSRTTAGFTPLHWAVMNNADESKIILAFKIASDQIAGEPDKPAEPSPEAPSEPAADKPPAAGPRPVFGKSLVVAIGRGEELSFVWLKDLKLWAGKFEVTNGQYRRFKPKHDSRFREKLSLNGNDQPVVQAKTDTR